MILNPGRVLKQTALKYANETAVINYERNRRFSFKQLNELTNKVCNMLVDQFKLGEGDIFATLLKNDNMSFLFTVSMKSTSTSLWLGIMDSITEHLYQIDYVKPSLIFIEKDLLDQYYEPLSERNIIIIALDEPDRPLNGVYNFWDLVKKSSPSDYDTQYVVDDASKHIWLLKFTGGTTGRGKCVKYSLSNYLSAGTNISFSEVFPNSRPKALLSTPITHASGGMVIPIYFKGGTVITLNRAEIDKFCQAIEEHKVELIYTVPTVLYRMVDMRLTEKYDLNSLKTIRYGASPISPSKLQDLIDQFGRIFIQGYAATEAWVPGTILEKEDHDISTEASKKKLNSVGIPVPGMEFKIVDEKGNEKPIKEAGEILIRGPHTVAGYYNNTTESKKNFTNDGFWKSGDIGYINDDGYIYLTDRKKDMIVSGGWNVYSTEVENCINTHPDVQQSIVVGLPDDDWGERVHAEVILKKGREISKEDLKDHCRNKISHYKVPKTIEFVETLPLSSVGKLLRREVRKKYWKDKKRLIS